MDTKFMEVRVIGWLRYCLVVPTDALIDDDLIINVLVMTYFYSWILEVQKVCDSSVHGTVYYCYHHDRSKTAGM